MQLPFRLRRLAAILLPSLLLAGLAPREVLAGNEQANVIQFVQLATTTVAEAPTTIRGNLLLATDGNFYAIGSAGGNGRGSIARIGPDGALSVVHTLQDNNEGASAYAGLMQASDGNLYGTTYLGGEKGLGVVFRYTMAGEYKVLRSLGQTKVDAQRAYAGLVQGPDGNLYGSGLRGGTSDKGAIFRVTLDGTYTVLHSFDGTDGENPEGTLIVGLDGNLYGTTLQGGSDGRGSVFRMALDGTVTTLYSFPSLSAFNELGLAVNATGANPRSALWLSPDGNYYGTAYQGGTNGYGTLFRMTPEGVVTVVHAFAGPLGDAGFPVSSVVQDAAGNFYGTSEQGGSINQGAAWRVSAAGQFSLLHSFLGTTTDGNKPYAALSVGSNYLYGVTSSDQTFGTGAIFKLDQGSGGVPPVELSVAPTDITIGAAVTLTWSSPTAVTCVAGGAWSDTVGTSGTLPETPASVGIYSYLLTCTDAAGVARTAYAAVNVRAPPTQSVDGGNGGGGALSIPALLLLGALALRKKL